MVVGYGWFCTPRHTLCSRSKPQLSWIPYSWDKSVRRSYQTGIPFPVLVRFYETYPLGFWMLYLGTKGLGFLPTSIYIYST